MPRIIAHRGLSALAPENTLAAFRACKDHGVTWFEFDVGLLADGTAAVMHDDTINRTTDSSGPLSALTSQDLPLIDAGSWFSPDFAGESIPTLHQTIDLMNELELNANLEIKAGVPHQLAVAIVLTELERLSPQRHVIISSFDPRIVMRVRRALPRRRRILATIDLAFVTQRGLPARAWRPLGAASGAMSIHPDVRTLTSRHVHTYVSAGYAVRPWTVNSIEQARRLVAWGVDAVFTDIAHEYPQEWR